MRLYGLKADTFARGGGGRNHFTAEELALLERMILARARLPEIRAALPTRTPASVEAKVRELKPGLIDMDAERAPRVRGLMPCTPFTLPNGDKGILCSGRGRTSRCACGRAATLLCDWKVPQRRSGTCDRPICARCTTSPAEGKDLCPEHAKAWEAWKSTAEAKGLMTSQPTELRSEA